MSRLDARGDWEELARASRYRADELAKKCGVSVRQLERFIQKEHGMPLHSWLNGLRQKRAELLIAEGKLEMKEISHDLGYRDPSHFSRNFREFHGLTPTAYRAAARKRKNAAN